MFTLLDTISGIGPDAKCGNSEIGSGISCKVWTKVKLSPYADRKKKHLHHYLLVIRSNDDCISR